MGEIVTVDGTEYFDALPSDRIPEGLRLPVGVGRPTLYRPIYAQMAIRLGASGYSLVAIAGKLGIGRATLFRWAAEHPEFRDALDKARVLAVAHYEDKLLRIADRGGGTGSVAACIYALKARAGADWLAPRAPAIGEVPDDIVHDAPASDPEASEEEIEIVRRALALRLSVDDADIDDAMLAAVVVSPEIPEPTPTGPETSITRALATLREKNQNREPSALDGVDAALDRFRKKVAPAPVEGEIIAPTPSRTKRIINI